MNPLSLLTLLKYWRYALAVATALSVAYVLHAADIRRIEARQITALAAQADQLRAECAKDKQLTEEISHAYEIKIASLRGQLAHAKRVFAPAACVPITLSAGEFHGAGRPDEPAGPHGVLADTLLEYAADAETYRLKLMSCQDFITKTWHLRGQ